MWSSDEMIQELKNRGKRITKQRKIMVEVIASKKVGDFKEIYYEISRKDPAIGQLLPPAQRGSDCPAGDGGNPSHRPGGAALDGAVRRPVRSPV